MNVIESEIVAYLRSQFSPELILLGGSRAVGLERPDSDWDLYLIGEYPVENERVAQNLRGAHLDIALFPIDSMEDKVLRIYYGPLKSLRILLDNDSADAQTIVSATRTAYERGPGLPSPERRVELSEDIERIFSKVHGYAEESTVATFHMSLFYRMLFPLWFELRGKWSLPAHEAIPVIRSEDPEFAKLLDDFSNVTTREKVEICANLAHHLFKAAAPE